MSQYISGRVHFVLSFGNWARPPRLRCEDWTLDSESGQRSIGHSVCGLTLRHQCVEFAKLHSEEAHAKGSSARRGGFGHCVGVAKCSCSTKDRFNSHTKQ